MAWIPIDICFISDVKGFEKRNIDKPQNEIVIRGSQEAFVETIRTNTSMIRRLVNNENLVIENTSVGVVSKTQCAICYIKDIANNSLVSEVKYRVNNLDIDYIISSGQLESLIKENSKSSLPESLSTERPDTASTALLEGKVVVIVNGSPTCLIMPCTFFDLLESPEDKNLNYKFGNFLKTSLKASYTSSAIFTSIPVKSNILSTITHTFFIYNFFKFRNRKIVFL